MGKRKRIPNESFFVREVTAGHEIESEVGMCTDPGSFSMSKVTAVQEIKNEADISRQGLRSSSCLCINLLFLSVQIVITEKEDASKCYTSFPSFTHFFP